jgi:2-polyprenyl-3-methyl-5-hydroxy-6-metoxy-1,4-benzoquinol methylase
MRAMWNERIRIKSIQRAVMEQGLRNLRDELIQIVPDISSQYTSFTVDTAYMKAKIRAQHAFQISLVKEGLKRFFGEAEEITIIDIGDSAGTHIQYIQGLDLKPNGNIHCLSVNLDAEAVKKIRSKGLEAMEARAEDLPSLGIHGDMLLCFETLEHLLDPTRFLKSIADSSGCRVLVVTVPYLSQSRIGLHHIRSHDPVTVSPENTHLLELSPSDWKLIFIHSGWKIEHEKISLQYPVRNILCLTKKLWEKTDYEGFYGAILKPDSTWSRLYKGWV